MLKGYTNRRTVGGIGKIEPVKSSEKGTPGKSPGRDSDQRLRAVFSGKWHTTPTMRPASEGGESNYGAFEIMSRLTCPTD